MGHQISNSLPPARVLAMLRDWAATPVRGRLGSNYGGMGVVSAAHTAPHSPTAAAALLTALGTDIPYLDGYFRSVHWSAGGGRLTFLTWTGLELELELGAV